MKRAIFLSVLALITLVLLAAGCETQKVEIGLAPIHEVKVNVTQSQPPQVSVYIKGGLRDTCTTFRDIATERRGNAVNIWVTTQTVRDVFCGFVYTFFEKTVDLGSDFNPEEPYTINVNGSTTTLFGRQVNLGQEFTLAPGRSATITGEGIDIKFIEVTEDSRCPRNVVCIWAGRVSCLLEITGTTPDTPSQRITISQPGLTEPYNQATFNGYVISFDVRPYPIAGASIHRDDYRLVMKVSKGAT